MPVNCICVPSNYMRNCKRSRFHLIPFEMVWLEHMFRRQCKNCCKFYLMMAIAFRKRQINQRIIDENCAKKTPFQTIKIQSTSLWKTLAGRIQAIALSQTGDNEIVGKIDSVLGLIVVDVPACEHPKATEKQRNKRETREKKIETNDANLVNPLSINFDKEEAMRCKYINIKDIRKKIRNLLMPYHTVCAVGVQIWYFAVGDFQVDLFRMSVCRGPSFSSAFMLLTEPASAFWSIA